MSLGSAPPNISSGPTRIGELRPSHLVTTGGVGAIVDLPSMSVMVRGLDAWSPEKAAAINEPRLLDTVRAVLGPQVRQLRAVPFDPAAEDDPWSRTGVPVTPFPRWLRCPRCYRLGPLDPPGQFELVHRWGRRPDLAKWVHSTCPRQAHVRPANRKACLPARFLVACDDGHLDDFPYVEFVHRGRPCDGPKLTMRDSSSVLSPRVAVTCTELHPSGPLSRSIQDAAGRKGGENLPCCRGRHPHLQQFEDCGKRLHLMVLGASNLWFSVTASALHLPQGLGLVDILAANWPLVSAQPSPEVLQLLIDQLDTLASLRNRPIAEVWACVESMREAGEPASANGAPAPGVDELLAAEWRLLARPTTDRQDEDFRAEPVRVPEGYDGLLDQVVQVSRLRVVRALVGCTRNESPERDDLKPPKSLPLSVGAPTWAPAVEQRGEGVFLQIQEQQVAEWEKLADNNPRVDALRAAYNRWRASRQLPLRGKFPIARYLLLHTLSHLLIRQISLECGYSSASIAERIYTGGAGEPHAGLLLCTAASDSEGTLGGLVALAQPEYLRRLLDQALRDARRCSSDPLCAEHVPIDPSQDLHAAACHACLFASETSCEVNNRFLDRAVIVDMTGDGLAFPIGR